MNRIILSLSCLFLAFMLNQACFAGSVDASDNHAAPSAFVMFYTGNVMGELDACG